MNKDTLRFIQDNVPEATVDEIEKAYQDQKEDVLETISFLLKIPPKPTPPKTEWDTRRDIFDTHDGELLKYAQQVKTASDKKSSSTKRT